MSGSAPVHNQKVTRWNTQETNIGHQALIREEPLSMRVHGQPYSVVMRTPGDEIAHAAGFCLAEGIIDTRDDLKNIAFCDGEASNVVTIALTPERYAKVISQMDRRAYVSQTSCGLCGKELIDHIHQEVIPIDKTAKVSIDQVNKCIDGLPALQPLRSQTRATHGVAAYNQNTVLLTSAEDVGRHNALDKAIGKLFLDDRLSEATLLILSSRISYEMVQKAARAGVAIIAALSRPTELAVKLAQSLNITLVCRENDNGLLIFCHSERLIP